MFDDNNLYNEEDLYKPSVGSKTIWITAGLTAAFFAIIALVPDYNALDQKKQDEAEANLESLKALFLPTIVPIEDTETTTALALPVTSNKRPILDHKNVR